MKLNKILSSLLVFVMLFASIIAVFPVSAFAEGADESVTLDFDNLPEGQISADTAHLVVEDLLNNTFTSAQEMLDYENAEKYLVSASAGNYTFYLNYYTGFVYYKNNVTGQILTSNPIDVGYLKSASKPYELMSQIEIEYAKSGTQSGDPLYSLNWIDEGATLVVSKIDGQGISVQYTLGDLSDTFIAPAVFLSDTFKNDICKPIFDSIEALMTEYCGEFDPAYAEGITVKKYPSKLFPLTSYKVTDYNLDDPFVLGEYDVDFIRSIITAYGQYARNYFNGQDCPELRKIDEFVSAVAKMFGSSGYSSLSPEYSDSGSIDKFKAQIPVLTEGKTVYKLLNFDSVDAFRSIHKAIGLALPEYTKDMADLHQQECKYVPVVNDTPLIKVTVRYILDKDGILTVDIPTDPANLIYSKDIYDIRSITPLKYFGYGDMNNNGYLFYPDGSGTIIEYSDFYYGSSSTEPNPAIAVESPVYGSDYAYAEINGQHHEQITMPVYGAVNDVKIGTAQDGYKTVTNGYFTIIESGASTAKLCFKSGGGTSKYITAYSKITPCPWDKYDLSQSVSVGNQGYYFVSAENGYEGSYKYRVNMLTDEKNGLDNLYTANKDYYPSDYAGMAKCYRDYLEKNGDIKALTEFSEDLPLYLEAFGSMDIVKRILTFPVTVSTSLTTFEDVETIYKELSDVTEARKALRAKATEYLNKAEDVKENNVVLSEDDRYLIKTYEDKAAHYTALADKIQNITNINFRLTGFANGGMYFNYPAKVKWESSVGGKRGFKDLLETAAEVNGKSNYTFGIYPDFDFLFINNTAAFDGVTKGSAAKMVDNRYASKQSYNSILQKYESLFALVVSTDSLDKLYTKFEKKYSKFDIDTMSVSTLGSTLNSNFDEDNLVNREKALSHVTDLFERMVNTEDPDNGYSLMTDVGNIYSVKYVDHILDVAIDSSHFRYSSFTVPFYGMVLHGYVKYAGSALNYAGAPDYNILRSIESGASLYYILCYENTNYLKDDELLSQYYGIDYASWNENILENYEIVNRAIGKLQDYLIVDHDALIAERIIDEDEMEANFQRLVDEYVDKLRQSIEAIVDETVAENAGNLGGLYKLVVDRDSVKARVDEILEACDDTAVVARIKAAAYAKIDTKLDALESEYPTGSFIINVSGDDIVYESKYSYVTDSLANDKSGYKRTDFTCDNGSVVMVVYQKGNDKVVFLLNYNNYKVDVKVDNSISLSLANGETETYTLDKYGCYKFTSSGVEIIK